jgi:hypothetical protein
MKYTAIEKFSRLLELYYSNQVIAIGQSFISTLYRRWSYSPSSYNVDMSSRAVCKHINK